jgi:glycosyltransferase involved in cell wall biosynthesis
MISIIIPMYNAQKTILSLLDSIDKQKFRDFEVIVIDDSSTDKSSQIVEGFKGSYTLNLLRVQENSGPAAARNLGSAKAKGDILFFLDSDLFLEEDAIRNVSEFFKDPESKCMIGVYSKYPAESGFIASYKSLQNYYYYTTSKVDKVSFFWGGIGAVRKDVFFEIGDFDTSYKGADYEDYEFGKRVLKKYPIHLRRNVILRHYFSNSLWKNFKDHFKRSGMWMNIYLKNRKFDNYVTTSSHGVGKASGFLAIIFLFLTMAYPHLFILSISLFMLFFYTNRLFFLLSFKEKGILFSLTTVILDLIFSIPIILGVTKEIIVHCFKYSSK